MAVSLSHAQGGTHITSPDTEQALKKIKREREREHRYKLFLVPVEWTWSVCCRTELTWHILAPAGMVGTREIDLRSENWHGRFDM